MTIIEKIKEDFLTARKNKDEYVARFLSTIVGEVQTIEKRGDPVTDERVVAILKRFKETADANLRYTPEFASVELNILKGYIPEQMTEEALKGVIDGIISDGMVTTGDIMKKLKASYAGLYDGKIAKRLIDTALKG